MGFSDVLDNSNVGGRDRMARTVLAVVFAIAAVRALQTGRRARGLVAGVVATGFALNTVTCFCTVNRLLGIDTTTDE
jgi:hypothetical protein